MIKNKKRIINITAISLLSAIYLISIPGSQSNATGFKAKFMSLFSRSRSNPVDGPNQVKDIHSFVRSQIRSFREITSKDDVLQTIKEDLGRNNDIIYSRYLLYNLSKYEPDSLVEKRDASSIRKYINKDIAIKVNLSLDSRGVLTGAKIYKGSKTHRFNFLNQINDDQDRGEPMLLKFDYTQRPFTIYEDKDMTKLQVGEKINDDAMIRKIYESKGTDPKLIAQAIKDHKVSVQRVTDGRIYKLRGQDAGMGVYVNHRDEIRSVDVIFQKDIKNAQK